MTPEQDHLLRALAGDMARTLAGADGAAAVLLLERCGLLSTPARSAPAARPGRIGIWDAGPQGHERAAALRDQWPFWANVPVIPPRGQRRRVVLVGESVARGFLFGTEFEPAGVLEATLAQAMGQAVEVVDLAKSDIQNVELAALIGAAPELTPDALVVFAGNNWFLHDKRDRHLEAAALREQGAAGLRELREQRLGEFAGTLRRQFEALSARFPVVLVVPEINLADWRLDAEADAPWLAPGRNRRWLEHRAAARAALAAGRPAEAAPLAREMVELDGGTAAAGWALLAGCAQAAGDLAAARAHLERARDAHLWDYTHQTPRVLSVTQRALRACAEPGRIAVVDLPRLFAARLDGGLPGRRLFLDYCHMTAEGIRLAMAATALEVAALLNGGAGLPPGLEEVAAAAPSPPARVAAAAHFAGALHSAHWGQTGPAISHHCHEAARQSPDIAQAMRAYLEIQIRRTPSWACAAVERLSAAATPFLRGYVLQHHGKMFDPVLLPAIAQALESHGLPSLAFLAELRRDERSLDSRPADLLDPYHRASLADLDWLEWPTHHRRAYAPTARYPWVVREPREVRFELTCRRGPGAGPGTCQPRINGTALAPIPLTAEWSTQRFAAPAALVQEGVNWLEIEWPRELTAGAAAIEHVAREHELGRIVPLLPVFAEISSLHATLA